MQINRPLAAVGAVLVSATVIAGGTPGIVTSPPKPVTQVVSSVDLLASENELWEALGATDLGQILQVLWFGGEFDSVEEIQQFVAFATSVLRDVGDTVVTFGEFVDPGLSLVGVSGVGDWLSAQNAFIGSILEPGWDPETWLLSIQAEDLIRPIAEFDLGWLYGVLGIPEEGYAPLDELLGLMTASVGYTINQSLVGFVGPIGLVSYILDNDIDLNEWDFFAPFENLESNFDLAGELDAISVRMLEILNSLESLEISGGILDWFGLVP